MKILQGDCIEQMKTLEDNSVDAIVTDPPYELGFMGKKWDNQGIAYNVDLWKEALRVLKPGGFLLAFGGTRTYHRLACGIEDAGFEIRDCIQWLYGSGFPKSLNIGKQIDKKPEILYTLEFKKWLGKQIEKCSKTKKQINDECGFTATSYRKTDGKDYWSSNFPSKEKWIKMKEVIGLSDDYDFVIRDNTKERGFIEPTGGLHGGTGNTVGKFTGKQLSDKSISKYAKEWEGWGTALKPANEPIVVARKPLSEKNVALNVLKWGTGGINIDACRIGNEKHIIKGGDENTEKFFHGGFKEVNKEVSGRFPANIILDEEAGKMLDEQTGTLKSGGPSYGHKYNYKGKEKNPNAIYSSDKRDYIVSAPVDKGGASRFFYCAKASKSERNFGCEELEPKNQYEQNKWSENDYRKGEGEKTTSPRKNNHPTVKPVKLMEYLVKLVSKENAVILDPFMGSGTTGIACLKLNRKFIGIEKEPEYIEIAKARLKPFIEQRRL